MLEDGGGGGGITRGAIGGVAEELALEDGGRGRCIRRGAIGGVAEEPRGVRRLSVAGGVYEYERGAFIGRV